MNNSDMAFFGIECIMLAYVVWMLADLYLQLRRNHFDQATSFWDRFSRYVVAVFFFDFSSLLLALKWCLPCPRRWEGLGSTVVAECLPSTKT